MILRDKGIFSLSTIQTSIMNGLKKKPGKASFVNEEDASVCHICHAKIVCSKYL